MTTNFAQGYTPPGVYISETSQPMGTSTGIPTARLTLIGMGQGEAQGSEQITFNSVAGARLAVRGIRETSLVLHVVSDDSEVESTEYTVTEVPNSNDDGDWWIEIHRVESSEIPENTSVWVNYSYTPPNYYQPRLFTQPADVADMYGPSVDYGTANPSNDTPVQVNSPLTLGAEIAFANGAGEVLVVPMETETNADSPQIRQALLNSYNKISDDYSASIIVPLTDGLDPDDTILAVGDLRGHLTSASANGYFRVGIYGQPQGDTNTPTQVINNGGARSRRVILPYASPEGMVYRSTSAGRLLLGHQYLAAAYGGIMASQPVALSITRRLVSGFAGIAGTLSTGDKNNYAGGGTAITEVDRQGRMIIRHGTTTDRSDFVSSEPSVVRARDTMVTMLQVMLDDTNLIGSPIDNDTPFAVKSIVQGALDYCQAQSIIVEYSPPQVQLASNNPSVIRVRFAYRPAFPLNYIEVNFAIDLTTGQSDVSELANT